MSANNGVRTDGSAFSAIVKSLDANKYATKKTIAQGLLDVALLTANASQLKYILQVGEKHEFYTLMLTLIIVSIVLQLIQGIVCVFVGTGVDLYEQQDAKKANLANNIILSLNLLLMVVNIIISTFEMKEDFSDTGDTTTAATKLLPTT